MLKKDYQISIKFSRVFIILFLTFLCLLFQSCITFTYNKPVVISSPERVQARYITNHIKGDLYIAELSGLKDKLGNPDSIKFNNKELATQFKNRLIDEFKNTNLFDNVVAEKSNATVSILETEMRDIQFFSSTGFTKSYYTRVQLTYTVKNLENRIVKKDTFTVEKNQEAFPLFAIFKMADIYGENILNGLSEIVVKIVDDFYSDQALIAELNSQGSKTQNKLETQVTSIKMNEGKLVGLIKSVDSVSNEIIVSSVVIGYLVNIGDTLYTVFDGAKIKMEVTFPMQTIAKCKVIDKKNISKLRVGDTVYK